MMRYQRVSPDCLHLNNGRKSSNLRTTYKEDEDSTTENGRIVPSYSFDGKAAAAAHPLRYNRSSTTPPRQDHHHHHNNNSFSSSHFISSDSPQSEGHPPKSHHHHHSHDSSPSRGGGGGGDMLLQWGHNKRSRGSRAESRAVGDDSSVHSRQVIKLQRRVMGGGPLLDKQGLLNQQIMPPPPPPSSSTTSHTRGGTLRSFSVPVREAGGSVPNNRNLEDRSAARNGSSSSNSGGGRVGVSRSAAEKRSPPSPDKTENKMGGSSSVTTATTVVGVGEKANGSFVAQGERGNHMESTEQREASHGGGEKVNLEVFEWPRIYISLSRKEKEDDFYAMKGTKLPQRPKKRAKNVDKTLQYCFPGMWLSDLTRGRYEVREKKCVKKQKRRGLKGMESMDSDSE